MINFNGTIVAQDKYIDSKSCFCTEMQSLKPKLSTVKFCFRGYFRLMASMRCTYGNPMNFTMEYMEEQMISVANANGFIDLQGEDRFRNDGGYTYHKQMKFLLIYVNPLLVSYMVLKTQSMKLIYSKILYY
jgi:branched-chain amino acid aminotransferase